MYSAYPLAGSSSLKRKYDYPLPVPTAYYYQPAAYYQPYNYPYGYAPPVVKKPKLTDDTGTPAAADVTSVSTTYIYCHQCNKKREKADCAHCTYVDVQVVAKDKPLKTRRCHTKYCRSCLKNRYNEDLDSIKANEAPTADQPGHIGERYDYKCPKCRDICNCARCRKAKGLDPTGKIANGSEGNNAKDDKKGKSKASGSGPSKAEEPTHTRAPRPRAKPSDPLPALKWTKLRTGLSVEDVEARLHIREFVLRFFSKVVPKAHLEELEQIGGNGRSRYEEDELVPWVSEPCLKSVILAFLGVLAEEESNGAIKKAIHNSAKELRTTGLGLSKIWLILSSLRDSLDASEPDSDSDTDSDVSETVPSFPDPMPLPDSAAYSTRRTRSAGFMVVDTVQMVPVILGLVDAVVETTVIRAELENGAKEGRDASRDAKDALRNVNDRWEKVKKDTETGKEQEFKTKREVYKQLLKDIDGASKVLTHRFNPRFSLLGMDRDGRAYYALSPSLSETDSALEFISTMAAETSDSTSRQASKTKRRRRGKREEDLNSLKDWSSFIAVYGKKPPPPLGTLPFKSVNSNAEDSDESDDDETADKWWAICQPAEMRKLVSWITAKYRLNEDDDSSSSTGSSSAPSPAIGWEDRGIEMSPYPSRVELKALVANLEDYVTGLEYRLRDGDGAVLGITDLDMKGKNKT